MLPSEEPVAASTRLQIATALRSVDNRAILSTARAGDQDGMGRLASTLRLSAAWNDRERH